MKRYVGWTIGIIAVFIFLWWGLIANRRSNESQAKQDEETVNARSVITLTDAKREAAGIQVGPVRRRSLQRVHQVPGRVKYDETRHVEIKAGTDGVLHEFKVKPGDHVSKGQTLAVLSSPEIGMARSDVLKQRAEWQVAVKQAERAQGTDKNLQQLVQDIDRKWSIEDIEAQYRGRQLGIYREKLLAAYARLILAESLVANIQTPNESRVVASRTLLERKSDRQAAEATLRTALEQAAFDSRQDRATAEAKAEDARRRLDIAQQRLSALLGYDEPPVEAKETEQPGSKSGVALTLVESRAPFDGTIESKRFSATERVKQGDTLLVLADTSRLWVEADIREQDWLAVDLQPDEELKLDFPAIPGRPAVGRLHYLGREVTPGTNAIPVVAWLENPDHRLRPGLFVRVSIPMGEPREVLAVPSAAVVAHEGHDFVFVSDAANSYRRRDVRTGDRVGDWVEISAGLSESEMIVEQGAFFLKSELLLEQEE